MTAAAKQPASQGAGVTLQAAADAFLSSPRCENANTRRAYAGVIDRMAVQLGSEKAVAEQARHEAEVANRAKTQFFTAASHAQRAADFLNNAATRIMPISA